MSNTHFTGSENKLLGKCLKFNLNSNFTNPHLEQLAASLDKHFIFNNDNSLRNACLDIVQNKVEQNENKSKHHKGLDEIKKLKKKTENNNLIIVKADKGGTCVILKDII